MTVFKKFVCIALAALMTVSLCGCFRWDNILPKPSATQQPETTQEATAAETAAPINTEPASPTEAAGTEAPEDTAAPTEAAADADSAFAALDLELFAEMAVGSADTYNQFIVSDPERFGIDPADVLQGWGDYYTYDSHMAYMDSCREVLQKLEAIDRDELSEQNKYAYDAIKRHYEQELLFEDYYYYDEPLTPVNGYHTAIPLSMVCFAVRNKSDAETYVVLMEDMPRLIDQIADYEQDKADHGQFMTVTAMQQVVESCEDFANTGSDCFLISYFDTVAEKAKELGMTDAEISALRARNDEAVLNGILPAYQRLADTLSKNRSKCSEFRGAADISGKKKDYFDLSVQKEAGTTEDIDDLIERLEQMGEDMLTEMIYAMILDPDALERYGEPISFGSIEDDMDWLTEFTAKYYPDMPEHTVNYVTIPDDLAEDFSPAAYLTPAFDDLYDNTILINPTSDDTTQLFTLAHEGAPGHMYQFLYFRNTPGLSLTQQVLEPTGCAEGWTVFTEYFVARNCPDMGESYCTMMNAESVYGNIFLPAYVSLQVNHNGWSVEDVEEYLSTMGMNDYAELLYEYAITMPTYAMSYAIGFTYMYEMYSDASPVSTRAHYEFFEKILSFGPTYLDLLEEYMK